MNRLVAIALAALVSVVGCGSESDSGESAKPAAGETITKTSDVGPVSAVVTLSPASPRVGDILTLSLRVTAKPGVAVEMPPFGEALGRFTVVKYQPRTETSDDGSTVHEQIYTLQPPGSGRQRIPQLRIEFKAADQTSPEELLTEELSLEVESVATGAELSKELSPAPGPLDDSPGLPWWIWLAVGACGVALGAAVLFALRSRERERIRRLRISAFDRAMRALRVLKEAGLPDEGNVDGWYVRLSGLVRRYLEERLQIRAPELTTEEFLQRTRTFGDLDEGVKASLSSFLAACDRVKFAAYQPSDQESTEVLETAEAILRDQEEFLRRREREAEPAKGAA